MKRIVTIILAALLLALSACGYSNEECDYCNSTQTKAYKTSQGTVYICKECSTHCFVCNEKATHHYENLVGSVTFVCDACYNDIKSYQ